MFRKRATPPVVPRQSQRTTPGPHVMKAASESSSHPPDLSGPAAAVLVALAGAALVAVGLLLVGVRDVRVGQWTPPPITVQAG